MIELDSEILYAAQLSLVLRDMRAELSSAAAVKRVLTFAFDRYGIEFIDLQVRPMPPATKPPTAKPIHEITCPLCRDTAMNERGLNTHMYKRHGTSYKEYMRQMALDEEGKQ